MEAMAWRLDQKSCGGGVEVMGLFMGFRRGFVHGFQAFGSDLGGVWVVFGLAFGWLDLGPLVVIFSDRLGDLFRWV